MTAGSDWPSSKGAAYAKTVAEAKNLNLDMDNPADREKLRRAVLDFVAGRKMRKPIGYGRNTLVPFLASIEILTSFLEAERAIH